MLSVLIAVSYFPAFQVWAVDDVSGNENTEAAGGPAASIDSEETQDAADGVVTKAADEEENPETEEQTDDISAEEDADDVTDEEMPEAELPEGTQLEKVESNAALGTAKSPAAPGVDENIENGTVTISEISENGEITGRAVPAEGYDLATIRLIGTDESGTVTELYVDYTKSSGGYDFGPVNCEGYDTVTAYFYDLDKWDGAVDLTWYDPDETSYDISTPAQLAGLAAITNGMVDGNVTEEYMIKDNEGRTFADGEYTHRYISTEPALVDLLSPNKSEGAGQVRDTAWRLPESEHRKLAEDDLHNDFMYRTVRLTADMDMGDKNWTPIGGKYAMNRDAENGYDAKVLDTRFQGVFDGQGHTVTINCDRMAKLGFAYAMEIAFIGYLGGGVDYNNGYPKDTCMDYAKYWVPTVRNLVVRGDVKGRRMVAGVVGRTGETNYGVVIENCVNYASVYATDMRGCAGIAGAAWGKGVIRNCYNAGVIHSNYWEHGGIIGSNGYEGSEGRDPVAADIYNCYNCGETAKYDRASDSWVYDGQEIGVDGEAFASYKVSNCYYLQPDSPEEGKTGYSVGESSINRKAKVTNVEAADLTSDETLEKLNANGEVFVKDTENINNGYPLLYFQRSSGSAKSTVTLRQVEGGTISSESDLTQIPYGTVIELSAKADKGKRLNGYKVTFGDSSEKLIPANGFYTVTGRDVTIEGIFGERVPSTIRFMEENDGAPYYIKVEKMSDADDGACDPPVVLRSGDQIDMDDVIRITPVDIRLTTTQPDIKYLEYTGKFGDPEYTEWSLEVVNKLARTYKVTGDVEDIDITVLPKTQGKQWTSVADTSWYKSGTKDFTLTTARQLAGLAKLCSSGTSFEGVTVKLGADISLDNTEANSGDNYGYERSWIGIGASEKNSFRGTFDGQGHTIRYMHRNFALGYSDGRNGGLFGVTVGAVIRNVNVESGTYTGNDGADMECSFKNGANGGSIAGNAIDTLIENCTASVKMEKAYSAGGIVGIAEGKTVIRNCSFSGTINGTNESIGGIVGKIGDNGVQITDCTNNGTITSVSWKVGGILGSGETYSAAVTRCVNNGSITTSMKGTSSYVHAVGGILGYAAGAITCSQCINHGDLKGLIQTYAMGGIAGTVLRGTIEDCYNTGSVSSESGSTKAQTSGIVNIGTNKSVSATVRNCYNIGAVSVGSSYAGVYGGAIAYGNASTNVITNVYCTDEATASIGGSAGIGGTTVAAANLKSLSVPLGTNFIADRKYVNNGYPVLAYQDPSFVSSVALSSLSKQGTGAIAMTWTASGLKDGFELYRSVNGSAYTLIYSGTAAGFTDANISVGNTYSYRVRAFRQSGSARYYGEWSSVQTLSVLLPAMSLKSAKNSKKKTVVIKWKRFSKAAGYELYRSTEPDGEYKMIKAVKVTKKIKKKKTLSFTNKKLKKKKTYYYKIRYYQKINGKIVYSELSAAKKVKIKK